MDALAPLMLFVLIATASPGGATTLATVSGANFGFRRSLPLITGIATGLASMGALAAAGLAGALLAAPALALAMKVAGSGYLLYLALQTARRGAPHLSDTTRPIGFLGGVWMLWHNPKGWAMTAGAAASFGSLIHGPLRFCILLGTVFGGFALLSLSAWCTAGLLFARAMRSDIQWRALNITLGVLLALSIVPMWLQF